MASFSRLQLAAALIEYDNDPTNPDAPMRSAQDSAIFAHMRRGNAAVPPIASRKSTDYLGVGLPSDYDSGSQSARQSAGPTHMRAASSLSGLVNPFGRDPGGEDDLEAAEDDPEENLEVDLASWGLDSFIPKEKGTKGGKKKEKEKEKEKTAVLPNPHPTVQRGSHHATRSSSFGDYDRLGAGGAFLDAEGTPPPPGDEHRRRSLGSAMELSGNMPERPLPRPRSLSTHALLESLPVTPPLHSVPFPSQSIRSSSPAPLHSAALRPNPLVGGRSYSTASMGSPAMLDNGEIDPNPFAIRPPSPSQASRFDPKAARSRTTSIGTLGSRALLNEDKENSFAIEPPSPSRSSRFDPKVIAHQRRQSNASMGSRMFFDNDAASMLSGPVQSSYPRERPYSTTLELMRPKVLVMPSPLQGAAAPPDQSRFHREGFEYSTDGPPLPGDARSRRASSATLLHDLNPPASAVPIASNSFIPNPRADLTLSQLTFRNSLMVGGQRDVSYADIDRGLERATEDGQQIIPTFPEDEQPVRPVSVVVDEPEPPSRPVGKLYGRSLVDELEARKATMRSKQRVFTGDDRPSMMARNPMKRSTTLIDPATLHQRPISQSTEGLVSPRPGLERRLSTGAKPLLTFDDDGSPAQNLRPRSSMPNTRSVFGVDTLWEREMAKLKDIEIQEEETRKQQEAREVAKQEKRNRKKKKGKGKEKDSPQPEASRSTSPHPDGRVSIAPPVLPAIPRNITRGPPPPMADDDEESDSDTDSDRAPRSQGPGNKGTEATGWFAGSSDDSKDGPVRTTGVGPRYPNRARGLSSRPQADEDSEEDLPLAATMDRAMQRATRLGHSTTVDDDSDEEKPLSTLLEKTKLGIPSFDFDNVGVRSHSNNPADDDDEDNQPLGLRASRLVSATTSGHDADEDEDDKPLGLHPDQQQRTQYQMFVQQQQQQQMMMQAQMHTSMMFSNPSMMGSGFFGPSMVPPMMMPMVPPISGSPPPAPQDPAKFNRVDKWRHGVTADA